MTARQDHRPRRRLGSIVWWIVFVLGFLYFFLPLLGTFVFSMRSEPLFSAYAVVVDDPQFAGSLFYSFLVGLITIVVSAMIIVRGEPAASRLRISMVASRPSIFGIWQSIRITSK